MHVRSQARRMLTTFPIFDVLCDLEEEFITNDIKGIDFGLIKLFSLFYADDIVIFF